MTNAARGLLFLGFLIGTAIPAQPQTASEIAPCVIHVESLDYPPVALAAHVDGVVVLRLSIESDGHVQSIEKLSGPGALTNAAEGNARKWVFKAGQQKKVEVRYEFRILAPTGSDRPLTEVQFDLPFHVLILSPARPVIAN